MLTRLRPRHYAILFAAIATSALVWYLATLPADDPAETFAATRNYYDQLEQIRSSVRAQIEREAGQQVRTRSEEEQVLERAHALTRDRLAETELPEQLHDVLQHAVEQDVLTRPGMPSDSPAVAAGSDTPLRLYRRAPASGPVLYY